MGQVDTSIVFNEIQISGSSLDYSTGKQQETIQKKQLEQRQFPELLNQLSGVHIRSYGSGSLATSSVRGGSAGHTLVLWNNVPISSPLLGLLDLSLLHRSAFDSATLVKGGLSSVWGSGAVAGLISLEENINIDQKPSIQLSSSIGSFGYRNYTGAFKLSNSFWSSKTIFDRETATNDFSFTVSPTLPSLTQTNAAFQKWNITHTSLFRVSSNTTLKLNYWFQHVDREIPPTTTQNVSEAVQEDRAHRFVSTIKKTGKDSETELILSYSAEELNFTDPLASIDSPSNFNRFFGRLVHSYTVIPGLHLKANLNAELSTATANAFSDDVNENRFSGVVQANYQKDALSTTLSVRQEIVDGERIPVMPSIAFDWKATNDIHVIASVNRNYRLPTLNDRFWRPGGNPNLLPESGWSQELGINFNTQKGKQQLSASATVYNRNMSNWILWTIAEGSSFFSPFNIARVRSSGLELASAYSYSLPKGILKLSVNYDYTRSTNQIALDFPRIEEGEQLLYTPVHQGNVNLQYASEQFSVQFETIANGAANGINESVDRSVVNNATAKYKLFKGSDYKLELFGQVNNLFNQSYFIIERRPIPGRHFRFGIQLNIL